MLKFLNSFKKGYETLNKIEVSRDNLLYNYHYLSLLNKKVRIAPVVKSNGYGHGIVNVAKILDPLQTPFFCVDSLFEAYELQKAKIKTPILVMGYTNPENLKIKKLPFSFTVYDIDTANILNQFQPGCKIHIFVDTGMYREGIPIKDLPNFLTAMKQFNNLTIEGLMSHLASSESKTDPLFVNQIKQFKKAKDKCKKYGINPKWIHISATGALINPETRKIIEKISNLTRAGLSLYGFSSSTYDENLKPALTLTTKIIQIKKVSKGEKLGYDGTFTAKKDTLIGVVPIGYYDGVDRRLSNKGTFLTDNIECPILGKVCMNINIIDLSRLPNPKAGQEVIVYSRNPKDKNSIANSARLCKTIPYDLLVNLAETTRRVII
ncbi:MAG: alanine racemase [Candidatus Daviesbacteria bacterium]|nr:alanine racemase [Candidatus Daviesbacteria bacterium]